MRKIFTIAVLAAVAVAGTSAPIPTRPASDTVRTPATSEPDTLTDNDTGDHGNVTRIEILRHFSK